jgi:hypothetical protein
MPLYAKDEDLAEQVSQLAEAQNLSKTEVLRRSLAAYRETLADEGEKKRKRRGIALQQIIDEARAHPSPPVTQEEIDDLMGGL